MDVIRALLRPQRDIAIPSYENEDRVDLLAKALFYMYRRIDIFAAWSPTNELMVAVKSLSAQDTENLDKMYNKTEFLNTIYHNKHRILSDWPVNKFRSLLVLSHTPQMEQLPEFNHPNFRFLVLSADSSNDEYVKTLSESDIYYEHQLPMELKRKILSVLLKKHAARNLANRDKIIGEYVELLAIEVQVARLYKAALRDKYKGSENNSKEQHPKLHTKPSISRIKGLRMAPDLAPESPQVRSPLRTASPPRIRTPSPTRTGCASQSPTKITLASSVPQSPSRSPVLARQSPSQTRLSPRTPSPTRPLSPARSPPPRLKLKTSSQNLQASVESPKLTMSQEPRKLLLEQSRLAVQARLTREEKILAGLL